MHLILLVALTMTAFAANSVLNRMALAGDEIGPADFALIRLGSGAVALTVMAWLRNRAVRLFSGVGVASVLALATYMLGFSFAYVSMDAGLGALLLFGGVQITMFAGALWQRETIPPARWLGAALAFGGLIWLFGPEARGGAGHGVWLMSAAAVGWGVYSLLGRRVSNPLVATAGNFLLAFPLAVAASLIWPDAATPGPRGVALAVLSGVVTSGLGYALWYSLLPRIPATVAAVAQLSVPVIAMLGGVLLLGEVIGPAALIAAAVVLGGVALSVLRR